MFEADAWTNRIFNAVNGLDVTEFTPEAYNRAAKDAIRRTVLWLQGDERQACPKVWHHGATAHGCILSPGHDGEHMEYGK